MHTLKIIGLAVIAPLPTGIYFLAKKLGASHRKSMWLAVPVGLVATVMLLGAMSGGSNTGGGAHIIVTHSGGTVIGTPLPPRRVVDDPVADCKASQKAAGVEVGKLDPNEVDANAHLGLPPPTPITQADYDLIIAECSGTPVGPVTPAPVASAIPTTPEAGLTEALNEVKEGCRKMAVEGFTADEVMAGLQQVKTFQSLDPDQKGLVTVACNEGFIAGGG